MVARQAAKVLASDCRCSSVRATSLMPIIVSLGAAGRAGFPRVSCARDRVLTATRPSCSLTLRTPPSSSRAESEHRRHFSQAQADDISDLAHGNVGPGHRHLLGSRGGLSETGCRCPPTSSSQRYAGPICQVYRNPREPVYGNPRTGVRNQSERVYVYDRDRQPSWGKCAAPVARRR